jgi:lipopolysaccharide transport system permease protein
MIENAIAVPSGGRSSLHIKANLLAHLVRRDFSARYRGASLGVLWSIISPLLMLSVFSFVFGTIFGSRWAGLDHGGGKVGFAVVLFSGIAMHAYLAEVSSRCVAIVRSNPNYVKKVVFPLELLVAATVISQFLHYLVAFALVLAGALVMGMVQHPMAILVAVAWTVPLALLAFALAFAWAGIGAYLRDMEQGVTFVSSVFLFISPIFYPMSVVPANYVAIFKINPLTSLVTGMRDALFSSASLDVASYLNISLLSLGFAIVAFFVFIRLKKGFADAV